MLFLKSLRDIPGHCLRNLASAWTTTGSTISALAASSTRTNHMLRQLTRVCVRYAERYIPNPYLYAVILTFIAVAAALVWTPSGLLKVLDSWYDGIWNILAFAMQMAPILGTSGSRADSSLVRFRLSR